jgi:tRNA(Ile)-lysidine synthase
MLAQSATALAQSRAALDRMTAAAAQSVMVERAGALCLNRDAVASTDPEILRRLLRQAITWLTCARHAPRADALQRLVASLQEGQAATLGGVRLVPAPAGLWLCREMRGLGPAVAPGAEWDGRWQVQGPFAAGDQVAALGAAGLAQLADWRSTGLPRAVLLATPAIWRQGQLVAAPLAGNFPEWQAEVVPACHAFNIAH